MNKLFITKKGSSGQALIVVLILLVVGMMVTTPFLYYASIMNKRVQIAEKEINAFYASDAAVEYAMYQLSYNEPPVLFNGILTENINGTITIVTTVPDSPPSSGTMFYYVVTTDSKVSGTTYSKVEATIECDRALRDPHPIAIKYPDGWAVIR